MQPIAHKSIELRVRTLLGLYLLVTHPPTIPNIAIGSACYWDLAFANHLPIELLYSGGNTG